MKRHILKMLLVGMTISAVLVGCGKEKKGDVNVEKTEVGDSNTNKTEEGKEEIQFELTQDGTLTFSGSGTLSYIDHRSISEESKEKIKKVVICEGITELGRQALVCFSSLEVVVLPDSLVKIGEEGLSSNYELKTIIFGENLQEIGADALSGCYSLENITIPDTVANIGEYAFSGCKKLKKVVLPSSLKSWKKNATKKCPMLDTVVNRSKISCKLDNDKGYRIWKVKGKKVTAVPKGKTAKASGIQVPITYKLQGGVRSGYLPSSYEYGKRVKVPLNVKKKGYKALSWNWQGKDSYSFVTYGVGPNAKKVILRPNWFKYKITNQAPGTVRVKIRHYKDKFWKYEIRYSESKDMKNAKTAYIRYASKDNNTVDVKGLKKGKTYYFQFCCYVDGESLAEPWMGKRKITIKK